MKIAVPLMLAWYFHRYEAVLKLRDFAVARVMLLVPVVLIARQPDLGTALLVTRGGLLRDLPRRAFVEDHLVGLGAGGAASLPFAVVDACTTTSASAS